MMGAIEPHFAALGLTRNPFPPTPDASFYFFTANLERDLAEVEHCILAHKGITLITGEVGLGKSTFVCRLLDDLAGKAVNYALVHNTFLQDAALLHAINLDFGIEATGDMARDIAALNEFLLEQRTLERTCLLVIDDAQNLTPKSLELLRLLTNLETAQEKLIQILITGQPELRVALARPELRQLTSRIVKHVRLEGMSRDEVGKYFEFRVNQAGAGGRIRLSSGALTLLYRASDGNPRRVHLILDRCLYGLLARRGSEIDRSLMRAAIADADMFSGFGKKAHKMRHIGFALVGLLLAGMGYSASWNYLGGNTVRAGHETALPPPSGTVAASAATPQPAQSAPAATLAACMKALPAMAGGEIRLIRIPVSRQKFARADGDTCLYNDDGNMWALWRSGWKQAELYSQQATPSVRALQAHLSRLGLLAPENIDGFFGAQTRAALAAFQLGIGGDPRGEPDDLTLFLIAGMDAGKSMKQAELHGK